MASPLMDRPGVPQPASRASDTTNQSQPAGCH
jgi:hypothetical protein